MYVRQSTIMFVNEERRHFQSDLLVGREKQVSSIKDFVSMHRMRKFKGR